MTTTTSTRTATIKITAHGTNHAVRATVRHGGRVIARTRLYPASNVAAAIADAVSTCDALCLAVQS